MKAKKLLWITLTLVVSSALLLTGSLALLAGATEGESPLPEASALPDVSDIPTEGENVELPGETVGDTVLTEKDGKITASFLTLEELTLLQERRDGGEWLTLSLEEMTAIVEETVRMFYDCHTLEVGVLKNGEYTVKTYNGYRYYTSDEYVKQDLWTAPNPEKDVFEIILARLAARHDAMCDNGRSNPVAPDQWLPETVYCFADMDPTDSDRMLQGVYGNGHITDYTENGWVMETYDYLRLNSYDFSISLYTHDEQICRSGYGGCQIETVLFYDEAFDKDFVSTEYVDGSRVVKIEVYREATRELVDSLVITDQDTAENIYNTFKSCMKKACDEYYTYGSASDYDYRSEYRVVVHMMRTLENEVVSHQWDECIAYPYGYTNEIYGQAWNGDIWNFMDYHVPFGKPLLDMLESYVAPMIPEE